MKLRLREAAQGLGIPVLMSTSDRGLVDVERFDLEPTRSAFHGLLGDVAADTMAGLSTVEKLPYLLQVFDPDRVSTRMGGSLLEVGRTLSGWPQLIGDVTVGAATVLEAIRRIGLDEPLASGRTQIDVGDLLGELAEPAGGAQPVTVDEPATSSVSTGLGQVIDAVVAAVNARIAAAVNGFSTEVTYTEPGTQRPLEAVVQLRPGGDHDLARWHPAVFDRETNRNHGTGATLAPEIAESLAQVARQHGARLHVMMDRDEITRTARVFADADRTRYLTPALHE